MALTKIPRGLLDTGIADSSDATAITIDSSENVTFAGNILKTGSLTVDVSGTLILDSDDGDLQLKDGGTQFASLYKSSNDFIVRSMISDGDFKIQGNDGGSTINALTIDMSDAGSAFFNNDVYIDKYLRLRTTDDQTNSWLFYTHTNDNLEINYNGSGNAEVVIDTSGNVGIGDTAPFAKLEVNNSSWSSGSPYGTVAYIEGGATHDLNWGHLVVSQSGTTTDTGGRISLGANGQNPIAGLRAKYKGATYGDLAFLTRPSGGTATERMVIDSTGIVTITPDTGATTGTLRLHNGNGNSTLGQIQFGHSGNVDHGSIQYTGNMDFFTGDSNDSRFFISSAGNVGINTSNPEHHLHVTEPGSTREDGIVKIGGSTEALGLELKYNQAGHTVTEIVANPTYTNTQSIMRLCVDRDANANQIVLTGQGNTGFGSDAPGSSRLYVYQDIDAVFTAYFLNDHSGGYGVGVRSDSNSMMYFYNGGTFKGRIYHNGTTMLYADQSDYRLKENVQTMTGSIDRIKKLNPVTFDWKADGKASEGFLAHEVQNVVPTAVAGEKDAEITELGEGIQIMDYGKVTPVLVGALQEALAKIEILETKVAALESK